MPADVNSRLARFIDENADRFVAIAQEIGHHPELGFQEVLAQRLLTEPLTGAGFAVETGLADMATSFRATWRGSANGPTIALLGEYDALPGLGHACGHNLMGTASVFAGLALRQVWPDLPGTVQVIGTPAEEGGGGKVLMVDAGVFKDVDAAMIFHPTAGQNMVHRGGLACQDITFTFHGKTAHAAAAPWNGVNAIDAVIQTFVNIGLLRQQLKPDARIHGIVTKGGEAANVIPDLTECVFIVRATQAPYLEEIKEKVINCARAAALATGTTMEFKMGLLFENRINNMVMARAFQRHLEEQGLTVAEPDPKAGVGSSDVGNVSRVCPAIHPYVAIAPAGVPGHHVLFREAALSETGSRGMLYAAKALAQTAADLLADPALLAAAKEEFSKAMAAGE
jgi:amidohydrolase